MWQPYSTNNPYVYSWSYTYEFSQINYCAHKYEEKITINRISLKNKTKITLWNQVPFSLHDHW
jgi:hypothetical protein